MTVRFINVDPKWNNFAIETSYGTADVWQDGDVVFEGEDCRGGSVDFTVTIADMEEIVEKYNEYIEKRALLIKAINDPKAQG